MITVDLDIMAMFAALLPDGSVLLEFAVGDDEHMAKVRMPPSEHSRRLARETVITLDLDDLPKVTPELAREVDEFVSAVQQRLVQRIARN